MGEILKTVAGTYLITIGVDTPPAATFGSLINFEYVGAGAGGASGHVDNGGGGGGGSTMLPDYPCNDGDTFTLIVASGGDPNAAPADGGVFDKDLVPILFDDSLALPGGNNVGGQGGVGIGGFTGGNGGVSGISTFGGGGGSSAGTNSDGNDGGAAGGVAPTGGGGGGQGGNPLGDGNPGSAPGGGGGGAGSGGNAGSGGGGQARILWNLTSNGRRNNSTMMTGLTIYG